MEERDTCSRLGRLSWTLSFLQHITHVEGSNGTTVQRRELVERDGSVDERRSLGESDLVNSRLGRERVHWIGTGIHAQVQGDD